MVLIVDGLIGDLLCPIYIFPLLYYMAASAQPRRGEMLKPFVDGDQLMEDG